MARLRWKVFGVRKAELVGDARGGVVGPHGWTGLGEAGLSNFTYTSKYGLAAVVVLRYVL